MPKQATLEINLDPELHAAFLAAAETAHRPAVEIVAELLRDYVDRQPEEPGYAPFLERKVKIARASMHAARGRPDAEVEADFAALRDRIRDVGP